MAEAKTEVNPKGIQKVVQQIVERLHPQRVILFGSYAYGQPRQESDVDLLVVVPNPPSHHAGWKIARQLTPYSHSPLQIVYMSPEEFDETKDVVGGLAYPAHHWGRLLYEAKP
jgi:predicted nucleotidyltransferase